MIVHAIGEYALHALIKLQDSADSTRTCLEIDA